MKNTLLSLLSKLEKYEASQEVEITEFELRKAVKEKEKIIEFISEYLK